MTNEQKSLIYRSAITGGASDSMISSLEKVLADTEHENPAYRSAMQMLAEAARHHYAPPRFPWWALIVLVGGLVIFALLEL